MKKVNFILVSVIMIITLSCSKNDTDDLQDETVNFFSSSPNNNFGPIAKKYDLSNNTETWLFGSFDNTGLHDTIRRIVVDKKDLNYYSTILIDKLNRPFMIYTTNKNGTNENILLKIDYPISQNKIIYSKYNYNWSTRNDSLLRQQVVDTIIGSSVFTYRTQVETNSNYWSKTYIQLNAIKNNINKFIDNNIDSELFPKSDYSLKSPKSTNSAILAVLVNQMLEEAKIRAQAEEVLSQPISLDDYVFSGDQSFSNFIDSSSNVEIPNPTGTPSNPNGTPSIPTMSLIYGKWKVVKRVSQNGTITYPNCTAGADACYLYLQSNGLHSQSYDGINFGVETTFSINGQIVNMTGGSATVNYVSTTELVWTSNSANIKVHFIRL